MTPALFDIEPTATTPVRKRTRRPSFAMSRLLGTIADRGGVDVRKGDVDEWYPVATWLAIVDHGWATVDRGTPDNRGGIESDYRYTLTADGWAAIDRQPNTAGPHIGDTVTVPPAAGCYAPVGVPMTLAKLDNSTERLAWIVGTVDGLPWAGWVPARYLSHIEPAEQTDDVCGCPVRPAPEIRGDEADTLTEHAADCTGPDA